MVRWVIGVSEGNHAPQRSQSSSMQTSQNQTYHPSDLLQWARLLFMRLLMTRSSIHGVARQGQVGQPDTSEAYILKPRYTGLENITDVAVFGVTLCKQGEGIEAKFFCTGNNDFG